MFCFLLRLCGVESAEQSSIQVNLWLEGKGSDLIAYLAYPAAMISHAFSAWITKVKSGLKVL
jgi:hypothetical protein